MMQPKAAIIVERLGDEAECARLALSGDQSGTVFPGTI
jgi:hypothetical protein